MPAAETLVLRTERLDLLPIGREHAQGLFQVLGAVSLYGFVTGSPPADEETLARRFELWESRVSPDGSELWFNWALKLRAEDKLIGHLQAGVLPDHADLAWFVGSQ